MAAKQRTLARQFEQTHTTRYKKLLVNGCSFTCNNSDHDICSWPYYLRDLVGFEEVVDCSQIGAGTSHIFNSTVNEIESDSTLTPDDTLVIIMWTGLTRTDVVATQDITKPLHPISNYNFDDKFSTLSLLQGSGDRALQNLWQQHNQLVDTDATIYEGLLKIIALEAYLKHKGFRFLFLSWKDPSTQLDRIQSPLVACVYSFLDPVRYLDEYSLTNQQRESNSGHPSPDGYLGWTRSCLIPYLVDSTICVPIVT